MNEPDKKPTTFQIFRDGVVALWWTLIGLAAAYEAARVVVIFFYYVLTGGE